MIFLITNPAYIQTPEGLSGWVGWFALLGLISFLLLRMWRFQQPLDRRKWLILLVLALLVPITSLIIPGIQFNTAGSITGIELTQNLSSLPLIFFPALPWFLAAGFLGPIPAAILALFSGLLVALWSTHNPFYPLEMIFLATLLGMMMYQNYRTLFFRILAHPLMAAFLLSLVYPVLFILDSLFMAGNSLAVRIDLALAQVGRSSLGVGISMLLGGMITEVVAVTRPARWGSQRALQPSPAESKLAARFLYGMAPLALILLVVLVVGDWFVAGRAARQMLEGRMASVGKMTAQSITPFLETGEKFISNLATEPVLSEGTTEEVSELLALRVRETPFFNQLVYLDANGIPLAGYPLESLDSIILSPEELDGINLSPTIPVQHFSVDPGPGAPAAIISFLTGVKDETGRFHGVLIGRSDLSLNQYFKPLQTILQSMPEVEGEGILIDENGFILFHPEASKVMLPYDGKLKAAPFFYNEALTDGTQKIVFYTPSSGGPWAVVLKVPARYARQQALDIAIPLLGIIVVITLVAVIFFRLGLRAVTASLQILAVEADHMAHGQFERPLHIGGEDEVGQLRRAFEKMRASLKARLDELNRLLVVSQGVASTFDIEGSMQPILESAVAIGASSARVIMAPAIVPVLESNAQAPLHFGCGSATDMFSYLDEQILLLSRQQERVILTSLTRPRIFDFPPGSSRPQALIAIALRHENLFYGSLWVAYELPHQFTEEEVSYLVTLAGQAALAAANVRLFLTSEIGRQQLEAILASTPDPVLVTDQLNQLLLANPAAIQILLGQALAGIGKPIEQIINQEKLIYLLRSSANEKGSAELVLQDGQIFLATASTVQAEGKRMGRVCVLRDITQFKELDALKSDFVSTVSHDLRSPLTLIRGYATMLQMVGDLNEQQKGYLQKIIGGVEKMSHLVNNLLDLGRIEAGVGLQLAKLPVSAVIESVINDFQLQAAQRRVKLSTEILQKSLPLIEADQALLQQALHNLVENAIKYTQSGGEVTIGLQLHPDHVIYEVRDTGMGIAPADQQRLFEKFYRSTHKGVEIERGTGLGLAIVKSIADRHGGRVWVESQLGRGSVFFLMIPIHQSHHAR